MVRNPRIAPGAKQTLKGLLQFRLIAFLEWLVQVTPSSKVILTGPASQIARVPSVVQELGMALVPTPDERTGARDPLVLTPLDHDIPDETWSEIWRQKITPVSAESAPLVNILGLEGNRDLVIFVGVKNMVGARAMTQGPSPPA